MSRALNDAPHVSEAVRRKVKEAAAALDYHPNLAAQSLIARRSYLIGLTYERPSPSYVVELQNGALGRLENERYRLVVLPFNHVASRPEELGKLLLRAGLDGVLLAPPACDQPVLLDMIERQRLPYARITPHSDLDRGLVVAMDEVAAGHTVAAHILSLGHRRVGIILGDPSHAASRGRLEGYRQAFQDGAVTIDDSLVGTGDFTYDVGYRVALELLDRPVRPTAILAQNDDMAVAAIAAARDLGLSVPQDLSVAGFDNSEVSRTAWPPLTTVHQPVREMAWDAANRLIAMLDGDTDSDAPRRRDHLHELLVRASTAPPASTG
ncbi:LacI family transcriptional regulator [Sphingopyxis bauzanensis]|nr:LacI family transcriptional regulator [Sphingopyxis bauzanensis]